MRIGRKITVNYVIRQLSLSISLIVNFICFLSYYAEENKGESFQMQKYLINSRFSLPEINVLPILNLQRLMLFGKKKWDEKNNFSWMGCHCNALFLLW